MTAPFKSRIVRDFAATAGATQTFTSPGFGTPKAAIVMVSRVTADGSATADMALSIGFVATDPSAATAQACEFCTSQDNVSTTFTLRGSLNNRILRIYDPTAGTIDAQATFLQWVTDGIEITWNNNPDGLYRITVILLTGTDLSAAVREGTTSSGAPGTATLTPGFQADVVLAFQRTNVAREARIGLGAAVRNSGANAGAQYMADDNSATAETRTQHLNVGVYQSWANIQSFVADTDVNHARVAINNFTATTFDLVNLDALSGSTAACLALGFGGATNYHLAASLLTPTVTGLQTVTTPGFDAGLLVMAMSGVGVVNDRTNQGVFSLGFSDMLTDSCVGLHDEHGLGTTNAGGYADSKLGALLDEDGASLLVEVSRVSSHPSGYILNWTDIDADDRAYWVLTIESHDPVAHAVTVTAGAATTAIGAQRVVQGSSPFWADFDGTADYLIVDHSALGDEHFLPVSVGTIEVWFSADSTDDAAILSLWDADILESAFRLRIESGELVLRVMDGFNDLERVVPTGHMVVAGVRYSCTFAWTAADSVELRLSYGGVHAAVSVDLSWTDFVIQTAVTKDMWIARDHETDDYFDGQVARVRHWNKLYSASELATLYACGSGLNVDPVAAIPLFYLPSPFNDTLLASLELYEYSDGTRSVPRRGYSHLANDLFTALDPANTPSARFGEVVCAGPATADIDAQRIVQTTLTVQAGAATASATGQRVSQSDAAAQAGAATTSVDAQRVFQVDVAVTADAATTSIDAQRVSQLAVAVTAGAATTTIDAQRVVQTTVALQAGAATVSINADVVRQTSVAVNAGAASATVDAQRIPQTSLALQAGVASTSIAAQRVPQTTLALQAGAATASVLAEVVGGIDVAVSASAATAAVDAQRVSQTSTAVSASAATAMADVQRVAQTSVAVTAGNATTAISGQVIRQATVVAEADAATAAVDAQRVSQSTLAVSSGNATASVDADRVVQTSVAVSASAASTAVLAQRISQTTTAVQAGAATTAISVTVGAGVDGTVAASAGAATTTISGQVVRQATVVADASVATTSVDAQRVFQTDIAITAGAATTSIDAQRVSQTSVSVAAGVATTAIDVHRVVHTSLAVSAGSAVATVLGQRVSQTTLALQAGLATTSIDVEIVGEVVADVDAQAGAATTAIGAQRVSQTALVIAAGPATTTIPVQRVAQTALALQAGAATAAVDAQVFQVTGSVLATAGGATAAVQGQRVVQGSVAALASPATAAVAAQRLAQASVLAVASGALAAVSGQRVAQTDLALLAGAATATIDGSVIDIEASVSAVADAATASVLGQRIVQGSVSAQAGAATVTLVAELGQGIVAQVHASAGDATTVILGQRIVQGAVGAIALPATAQVSGAFGVEGAVAAQAGLATASVLGQRVVQGAINLFASPAILRAFSDFVPGTQTAPVVLFVDTSTAVLTQQAPAVLIVRPSRYDVLVRDTEALLFYDFARQHRTGVVNAVASPATAAIQGVVL